MAMDEHECAGCLVSRPLRASAGHVLLIRGPAQRGPSVNREFGLHALGVVLEPNDQSQS